MGACLYAVELSKEWDFLAFVFDVAGGHSANSGFLYNGENVRPASAGIEDHPMLLSNHIREFRELIYQQCGHKFKQLLIQMEQETGRIKIDFEFEDSIRWAIAPSKLKEMRAKLRPIFE